MEHIDTQARIDRANRRGTIIISAIIIINIIAVVSILSWRL